MLAGLFYKQIGFHACDAKSSADGVTEVRERDMDRVIRSESLTLCREADFSEDVDFSNEVSVTATGCNGAQHRSSLPKCDGCDLHSGFGSSGSDVEEILTEEDVGTFFQKFKAVVGGYLIRMRWRSGFCRKLRRFILENCKVENLSIGERGATSSKRRFYVSQLISFLEDGAAPFVDYIKAGGHFGVFPASHQTSDLKEQTERPISVEPAKRVMAAHSSIEAKVNTDFIQFSLMETIGLHDVTSENATTIVNSSFLAARRRDFLEKIFSSETREGTASNFYTTVASGIFCPLTFSQPLTAMYGGGYGQLVRHIEQISEN